MNALLLDAEVLRLYGLLEHAIAAERERQVTVEGFTAEHDAGHEPELRAAASCYEFQAKVLMLTPKVVLPLAPPSWPWDAQWWKPVVDVDGNLIKAGALKLAAADEEKAAALRVNGPVVEDVTIDDISFALRTATIGAHCMSPGFTAWVRTSIGWTTGTEMLPSSVLAERIWKRNYGPGSERRLVTTVEQPVDVYELDVPPRFPVDVCPSCFLERPCPCQDGL
ncbi:hypothetical protein BH09ACT9_BH09ACT9_00380 [soil metagenome]